MSLVVITGSNRGIGLELVKLYLQRGNQVIAACRQASEALKKTGATVVENIEVTDPQSIQQLSKTLGHRPIDILINNAGILSEEQFPHLDFDSIRKQFEVNSLGPLQVTQGLQSHFQAGTKIALITSRMGSIGDNGSGNYYGYRMSKAALNMAGANLARDLKPQKVSVFILHPGMVATEMTGGQGIPPKEAAAQLAERIDALSLADSGKFWHASGEELPW